METPKNKIIIWGADGFNTLGLLRQLGQDDFDLFFLIKGSASYASKSKFCKKFVETRKKFLTNLVRCAKLNRLTAERLRMFCTL